MTEFPLTITAWAAVLLGALYLLLTLRVIGQRRGQAIVHGDGGDKIMLKKIRGHANAAEQIPLGLILIGLTEMLVAAWVPGVLATLLVVGRVMHGAYFGWHGLPHVLRVGGMALTLLAQLGGIIAVLAGLLMAG